MLDPIFSIRVTVVVPPGQAVSLSFTNIVSDQKQQLLNRADLYSDISAARRTFEISSSQMQEELHDLNITAEDAMLFQMLVGHMLFRQQAFASSHKLTRNRLGREGLWVCNSVTSLSLSLSLSLSMVFLTFVSNQTSNRRTAFLGIGRFASF